MLKCYSTEDWARFLCPVKLCVGGLQQVAVLLAICGRSAEFCMGDCTY